MTQTGVEEEDKINDCIYHNKDKEIFYLYQQILVIKLITSFFLFAKEKNINELRAKFSIFSVE